MERGGTGRADKAIHNIIHSSITAGLILVLLFVIQAVGMSPIQEQTPGIQKEHKGWLQSSYAEPLSYTGEDGITWTYTLDNTGNATITGCNTVPAGGTLAIPFEVAGHDVTQIGNEAFRASGQDSVFKQLRHVILPETVVTIGQNVFWECDNLTRVTLPSHLLSIQASAFYGCPLKQIALPDTLQSIGGGAFWGAQFTSVTLPANGEFRLTPSAFSGCSSLTAFIAPDESFYSTNDGIVYSKDGTVLMAWPVGRTEVSFSVPGTVTGIGERAFCTSKLEEINLPTNLTTIGKNAFESCRKLKSMVIPAGVTVIPDGCFSACIGLEKVSLPNTLTEIGAVAFHRCISMKEIDLPDSISKIGPIAFSAGALENVALPQNLKTVERELFGGTQTLQRVYIPEGVESIDGNAFKGAGSGLVLYGNGSVLEDFALESGLAMVNGTKEIFEAAVASAQQPVCAHSLQFRPAVSATCLSKGRLAHYYCTVCGQRFKDADGEEALSGDDVTVPKLAHSLQAVSPKEATYEETGCIAHWECTMCHRCFSDEAGTNALTSSEVVIPKLPNPDDPTGQGGSGGSGDATDPTGENTGGTGGTGSGNGDGTSPSPGNTAGTGSGATAGNTSGSGAANGTGGTSGNTTGGGSVSNSGTSNAAKPVQASKPVSTSKPSASADSKKPTKAADTSKSKKPAKQRIKGKSRYSKTIGQRFRLKLKAKTKLTYRSSDKSVVKVNSRGRVTVKGYGTCRITVTAKATTKYKKAVKVITIKARLAAPQLKAKNKKGKRIKLSWSKVSGAKGYLLYVRIPGQKNYKLALKKSSRVKSVTHRGLTTGKSYSYRLRAYTKVKGKIVPGPWSQTMTVKVRK